MVAAGPAADDASKAAGGEDQRLADCSAGLAVVCSVVLPRTSLRYGLGRTPDGLMRSMGFVQAGSTAVRGPSNQLLTSGCCCRCGAGSGWTQRLDGATVAAIRSTEAPWRTISRKQQPNGQNQAARRRGRGRQWPDFFFQPPFFSKKSVLRRQILLGFEAKAGPDSPQNPWPARTRVCERPPAGHGHLRSGPRSGRLLRPGPRRTQLGPGGSCWRVGLPERAAHADSDRRIGPGRSSSISPA